MSIFKSKIHKIRLAGFCLFFVFSLSFPEAQVRGGEARGSLRTFSRVFPGLTPVQRQRAFSTAGFKNAFTKNEKPQIVPAANSDVDLMGMVMERTPTQLVEAVILVPYAGRQLSKLDAFNTIGRIQHISDYLITTTTRGVRKQIPLFEESTRLDDPKKRRPIPDPPPATSLPPKDTIYFCLKDTFFGNTFFRGDFSESRYGVSYDLTNFTAVWFLVFPVMKAEKFAAAIYVEPVREGTLIYGMAGIDVPEFLLSKINLAFQIDRRLTIFINWLSDGLKLLI